MWRKQCSPVALSHSSHVRLIVVRVGLLERLCYTGCICTLVNLMNNTCVYLRRLWKQSRQHVWTLVPKAKRLKSSDLMRRLQRHISEHIHCQRLINSADSRDCWGVGGGFRPFSAYHEKWFGFPHKGGGTFIENEAAVRRSGGAPSEGASTLQSDTILSVFAASFTDSAFSFCFMSALLRPHF